MAGKEKGLEELFVETLKDIYFAEKQILRSLPKMARAATTEDLRSAFQKHRDETETQIERIEQVFESMGRTARGKSCQAILGIVEESQEVMEEFKGSHALDAGILASAQAVEHYEISRYGTLVTWAKQLGLKDAAKLLGQTLDEEKNTDILLSKLAEQAVNRKAA